MMVLAESRPLDPHRHICSSIRVNTVSNSVDVIIMLKCKMTTKCIRSWTEAGQ